MRGYPDLGLASRSYRMAKYPRPTGFRCGTCGEIHAGLPMDVGFGKPADYFAVPPAERAERCASTSDWCVIDGSRFFVRGCAFVPVPEAGDQFAWGMWVEIVEPDFKTYRDTYDADGSAVPPFPGKLAGEHRGYEGLDGHPVDVQLGPKGARPTFRLRPSDHLLYREQRDGITLHRVRVMLTTLFPDQPF